MRPSSKMAKMNLVVGKRPVVLPTHRCSVEDVEHEVRKLNPPFVVKPADPGEKSFAVRRRVFLQAGDGLRVECENDTELRFACKLAAEEHNQWQTTYDTLQIMKETEQMEREAEMRQAGEVEEDEDIPREEEDISIEEWAQMGYKWFKKEEVHYL